MQDSQGLFGNTGFQDFDCQVSTGEFTPHINPLEAKGVRTICDNPAGLNIVTCKDSRKEKFLAEVGGLALDNVLNSILAVKDAYIPIFDFRTLEQALQTTSEVVGLTLADILKRAMKEKAGIYVMNSITFRDLEMISELSKHKKVILFLTGCDVLIETVWHRRIACDFFKVLLAMDFWAVSGFNFSVFGGECPFAQALNQKRSLYSSVLLEQNGIATIPHIYAINEYHIERYQNWLSLNPLLTLVTMNCQMQKSPKDRAAVIEAVQALLIHNERLHIILQGFWFSHAHRFGGFLDRIHFAEGKAVKFGQNYQHVDHKVIAESRQFKRGEYKDLILQNIAIRRTELEKIRVNNI